MKRIQDIDRGPKEKKVEPKPAAPVVVQQAQVQPQRRPPTTRQVSEDDEIARIKRENKAATSSQAPIVVETERAERPTSILKKAANADETTTEVRDSKISMSLTRFSKTNLHSFVLFLDAISSVDNNNNHNFAEIACT